MPRAINGNLKWVIGAVAALIALGSWAGVNTTKINNHDQAIREMRREQRRTLIIVTRIAAALDVETPE